MDSTAMVATSYAVSSKLGLGSLFRLCPLSVLKGALAGIGIYLLKSAISTAADHPIETGHDLFEYAGWKRRSDLDCWRHARHGHQLHRHSSELLGGRVRRGN